MELAGFQASSWLFGGFTARAMALSSLPERSVEDLCIRPASWWWNVSHQRLACLLQVQLPGTWFAAPSACPCGSTGMTSASKEDWTVAKSSSPRTLGFGGTTCVDDSHVVLGSLFLSYLIAYHDIMLFFLSSLIRMIDYCWLSVWSLASGSDMVMVGYVELLWIIWPQVNHYRPLMVGTWWYLIVVGNQNKIWIGKGFQIIGLVLRLCICDCDMLLLITMMHILMQLFDSMSVWSQASGSEMVMVGYFQWLLTFKPQSNHYRPSMVGTWWYWLYLATKIRYELEKGSRSLDWF